jgi:hypothetical protein
MLLVGLAIGPTLALADGVWSGVKERAGAVYERGRVLSLEALAAGAELAAKGLGQAQSVAEDEAAFTRFIERGFEVSAEARGALGGERADLTKPLSRGVAIYRVTDSGLRLETTLVGTRVWPDEALNAPGTGETD